jgi:hypothetical protein
MLMSYENIFNELTLNVVNKNGDQLCKFEMSVNYVDSDTMAVPEINIFFITKSQNEFEDDLQDELICFIQKAENRKKFFTEKELTIVCKLGNGYAFNLELQQDEEEKRFDEYLEKGGNCPFCQSPGIEGLEVEFEGAQCIRNVFCNSCEKAWTDVYHLVSLRNL